MAGPLLVEPLERRLETGWAPSAHILEGIRRIGPDGERRVQARLATALGKFEPPVRERAAHRRLFSFLAQVEVIGIEIPRKALEVASPQKQPLLMQQLEDEVFHALVFLEMARRLGHVDPPVAEAERLLDLIRAQEDPQVSALLLNLIGEGWIENLLEHASRWGAAEPVFKMVLADEERHVHEAHDHVDAVDPAAVEPIVRSFEEGLFRLAQHPRVLLPILAVAGEDGVRELTMGAMMAHREALAEIGIDPVEAVQEMERNLDVLDLEPLVDERHRPTPIEPATQWRRTSLQMWDPPRDPVMNGWIEVPVDHVPRKLLTPLVIAVLGQVWKEYPRINRYTVGGRTYTPSGAHVAVRVAIGDDDESLSSVVVPDADQRSLRDIIRILRHGVENMNEVGTRMDATLGRRPRTAQDDEPLSEILRDPELMGMLPPETVPASVSVSNVGRYGLHAGFGALPGALGQSVEIIVGRVSRRPVWKRWRYKPADVVTLGCSADHRLIDGIHAAEAMQRIEQALSPANVRRIMRREDTIPADKDVGKALEEYGWSQERFAQGFGTMAWNACKLPWWLGWMCWLFKK